VTYVIKIVNKTHQCDKLFGILTSEFCSKKYTMTIKGGAWLSPLDLFSKKVHLIFDFEKFLYFFGFFTHTDGVTIWIPKYSH